MGLKKRTETAFVMFDVVYADGALSSRRRVPNAVLGGLDGDGPAQAIIEQQDRAIADASGRPCVTIKSIVRSPR
jgi:hypothetical protein